MAKNLKTFICSVSAVHMSPGVSLEPDRNVLICRIDESENSLGKFVTAVGHLPLLLVRYESIEAKEYALERARQLLPEDEGWRHHAAVMIEIPRSMFIQMQLFVTIREAVHKALVFTGFRH